MNNMQNIESNFIDTLNLYQAANSNPESIKKNFVIRVHEFETILDALKSKKGKDPLQHELILGRRGSGKSTLLKRIEIELNEDKKLSGKYIPVYLAEEQAGIYRLSDLWFEALCELQERENLSIELKAFSSFSDEQEYTRYLFEEINKLLVSANKKAVLLLDNLDRILENLKNEGHLLRELLLNFNNVQIIGGSTRMDEHFWKYDQPFYEFFRQHKLGSLSFNEIHTLLNMWSEVMKIGQLKDYALVHRGKIESIRILTDGMPRTLQFFIKILLTENEMYGFQYIRKIMDRATPLYQERLNNLTAPQRKIVSEMAFIWEAASTKQLVDACRMESKLISAYLKQLISFGIIKKTDTKTKNKLYRISERFFNMWLIVTQGNPDQKRKARYLSIFLENWYDADKIRQLAGEHLKALKNKTLNFDKATVLTKAYSQSKYISTVLRDELIENTNLLSDVKVKYSSFPEQNKKIIEIVNKHIENKKYNNAINEINKIENEADGVKFFSLGLVYDLSKIFEKAEKYYLLAIEKGNANAMYNLALLYLLNNRNPSKSLKLIREYNINNSSQSSKELELIIEIWNGIFMNIDKKMGLILNHDDKGDLSVFFEYLLILGQKNLLLSYFESEKYGKKLQEKYILFYYAILILNNKMGDKILKIPTEVMPTVNDILKTIKENSKRYSV